MKRKLFIGKLQSIIAKRDLFLFLTLVLLGVVVLLSMALIKTVGNQRIVLIPMPLKQAGWVDKARVSEGYLTEMTRYYSTLFLDISPDSPSSQIEEILHYSASESNSALKSQLMSETQYLKRNHVTTFFSPASVAVDTNTLIADITGDLHIMVGKEEVKVSRVTYRAHYVYRNGALLIAGFNEVKKDAK
ncbi:MAG: type IV conjugative transfer system protein TraE [Legionellales bacterium]|nr:type IV conjugative transfer system protein TraE [Legionellales bacterium]